MTLPDVDTLDTFGGALENYAPVVDATTDRDAAADNKMYADVAAMTRTSDRTWCAFKAAASTGAMVLVGSDAHWKKTTTTAPQLARVSAGVFTITWPTLVMDEIPSDRPGYNGSGHTVNFRGARWNCRSASTAYFVNVDISANVIAVYIFLGSTAALNDAVGVTFDIFTI